MSCEFIESAEDLSVHPKSQVELDYKENYNFIIGDLHANCMKFIYILIRYGVMKLQNPTVAYEVLTNITNKSADSITAKDLARFRSILLIAEYQSNVSLTIIGDDLADRCQNDIFILLIYQALHMRDVPYTIILSNHNELFIRSIKSGVYIEELVEKGVRSDGTPYIINFQKSLENLWKLIDRQIISLDDVQEIIEEIYLPYVKIIGYQQLQEHQLILFTHAPVGLKEIEKACDAFAIEYNDHTTKDLSCSIDLLNLKYQETHSLTRQQSKGIHPLLYRRSLKNDFNLTPTNNPSLHIHLFHGHVGEEPDWGEQTSYSDFEYLYNLDSNLGKGTEMNKGILKIAALHIPPQLENQEDIESEEETSHHPRP